MVRVAVAGGTSGLGRSVTEAMLTLNKHTVFVLSRSDSTVFATKPELTVLIIDYTNPNSIAAMLKAEMIETVISCLPQHGEEHLQVQNTLIEGAALSGTVKRFAPSDFGIDYLEAAKKNYPFPGKAAKLAAIEKLKATPELKYTRFITGTFMDYFGPAAIPTNLKTISLVLDMDRNKAVVPGDGNTPIVLSHSSTIAKFVAASLEIEWPEASFIIGQRLTPNELVAIAEGVKGTKFDVVHDSIEDMQAGKNTELECNVPRYGVMPKAVIDYISREWAVAAAKGVIDFVTKGSLNELLPEVKPVSMREFLSGKAERSA